jgi:hypothetical protein
MKMRAKLFLAGIFLATLTTMAFTQQPGSGQGQRNGTGKGTAYVDANKNGICDNYENKTVNCARHGKNGTACMGGCGQRARQGCGQRAGHGSGQSQGRDQVKGSNFVDANKNGICDNFEAATKK